MLKIQLILALFFRLYYKTCHESVRDGWTNPDFCEQIVSVFVDGLQKYSIVVECCNEHVNDTDEPQVSLGVVLSSSCVHRSKSACRATAQQGRDTTGGVHNLPKAAGRVYRAATPLFPPRWNTNN